MSEYEMVEHNGEQVRKYPDGSLRSPGGQLVRPMAGSAPAITSETAHSMHQRRRELQYQAFDKALTLHPDHATPQDGLVAMNAGVIERAADGDPRAYDVAMRHSGYGATRGTGSDSGGNSITLSLSDAVAADGLRLLAEFLAAGDG